MDHVDLKVVLLGKEYCGKTSLVERFLNDRFAGENKYQNTIGAAYGAKKLDNISSDGKSVILGVWDTAGSERYQAMTKIYYRGARAAIVCYDVTDPDSFERLRFWIAELAKFEPACKVYLAATKVDLLVPKAKRLIDYHETTDLAEEIGSTVTETSAKTGLNVHQLFDKIANDYVSDPKNSLTSFEHGFNLSNVSSRKNADGKLCC